MARTLKSYFRTQWPVLLSVIITVAVWAALQAADVWSGEGSAERHITFSITLLMACLWVAGTPHSAVVSVLPVVLFPLLGSGIKDLSNQYFNKTNFVLFGSFLLSIAIQEVGLHRRICLKLLSSVSGDPKVVLLAFMGMTAALSAFMSNTATAALVCPMAASMYEQLEGGKRPNGTTDAENPRELQEQGGDYVPPNDDSSGHSSDSSESSDEKESLRPFFEKLLLGLPYACAMGGIATLTGTGTNLAFAQIYGTMVHKTISYGGFLLVGLPMAVCQLLVCWLWLAFGPGRLGLPAGYRFPTTELGEAYSKLGRITASEIVVAVMCLLTVLGWFFRKPGFMPGFAQLFPHPEVIDDSVVVLVTSLSLFFIPRRASEDGGRGGTILEWSKVHHELPLGLFLLIGAGSAVSFAFSKSGLSTAVGQELTQGLGGASHFTVVLISCILGAAMSQVTSDVAVANILLPVVFGMAQSMKVDPMLLMLPVALACSLPYMLIISTPPNAIAFQTGFVTQASMLKNGFPLVVTGLVFVLCFGYGVGMPA